MASTSTDDTETATLVFDSESPARSPAIDSTVPLTDIIPFEDDETQLLENEDGDDDEVLIKQVVDDSECEGTDATQVLTGNESGSDGECGRDSELAQELPACGVFNGRKCGKGNNISISTSPGHGVSRPSPGSVPRSFMSVRTSSLRASSLTASQKRNPSGSDSRERFNQDNNSQPEEAAVGKNNFVSGITAGLNALSGKQCGPGSAPKSFMSVRVESLRGSGLAAAHKMNLTVTDSEARSVYGSKESENVVCNDNEVTAIRYPTSNSTQGMEAGADHGTVNCDGIIEGSRDEIDCRVARSAARRLFTGDGPDSDSSLPGSATEGHEFAGLSYVGSQEPGELSQANALNIVDRLISVDDEDLPEEMKWGSTIKGNSPPSSKTKGAHILAQRAKTRSPVGKSGIFDWDDRHEDEGGGYFFIKRKDELLGGLHVRRSYTQPKSSMPHNTINSKATVDKLREEEVDLKLCHKTLGLTRSDSRLMTRSLNVNENLRRVSKSRIRKNMSDELDEQLTLVTSTRQQEASGISKDALRICVAGVGTQMDVEAMEALGGGVPCNPGTNIACQINPNDIEACSRDETRNKDCSRKACRRRTSDLGGILRQSKRIKALDTSLSSETSRKNLMDQKNKGRRVNAPEHLETRNAACENKIIDQTNQGSVMKKTWIREADGSHKSSNGKLSTPVAHRTRKSLAENPSKSSEFSCDNHGAGTDDILEAMEKKKRQRSKTSQKKSIDQENKGLVSDTVTRGKVKNVNTSKHMDTETAANNISNAVGRSSETIDQINPVSATNMDKSCINETDRLHMLSTSNGNMSSSKGQMQEDCRIPTPVAHRTRKSKGINTLTSSISLFDDIGDRVDKVVMTRGERRRQRSLGVDTLKGKNDESFSVLNGGVRKDKSVQQEPFDSGPHKKNVNTSNKTSDVRRYHRRKRTRQNISKYTDDVANEDMPSTYEIEADGQSMTKQKKLRVDTTNNGPKIHQKRITRSFVHSNPSSLSSEKRPEGSLIRQHVIERAEATVNFSSNFMNERAASKDNFRQITSACPGKRRGQDYLSPVKGAEASASLHVSPAGKLKQSDASRVTPSSNCATPINGASPLCVGNDYKESCKTSLLRSPLMRELSRLDANEVLHSSASKDSRKRKDMAYVHVLFSRHLDEDTIRQQKKILIKLGASIARLSSEATHFVTDEFVRTRNMLESMASGKPVVTHLWLESCAQASCFIDEKNYILRDFKKEKEIGFNMPLSLARARQSPLLQNRRVYITSSVKPSKKILASLVKAVHGQVLERLGTTAAKDDKIPDDLLVLSCEEDFVTCVPLLEKGAAVYSSELLLNGIVIHKLDYERHRLFADRVKTTRSTLRLRKGNGDQFHPVNS